jgi:general stress protein YciG
MSPDAEKARHGGLAVRDKYGPEYYRELGRKGGQQTKARYGVEHYTRIGKRGGAARS